MLVLLLLVSTGCTGPDPKRVMYRFEVAYQLQDREEAMKYCTANYIENGLPLESDMGHMGPVGNRYPTPVEMIPTYKEYSKWLTSSVSGGTARVQLHRPFSVDILYILIREPGGWKIDSSQELDE